MEDAASAVPTLSRTTQSATVTLLAVLRMPAPPLLATPPLMVRPLIRLLTPESELPTSMTESPAPSMVRNAAPGPAIPVASGDKEGTVGEVDGRPGDRVEVGGATGAVREGDGAAVDIGVAERLAQGAATAVGVSAWIKVGRAGDEKIVLNDGRGSRGGIDGEVTRAQ